MESEIGQIIKDTPICIDYWHEKPRVKLFRFLTQFHPDYVVGLYSSFREKIYTSKINRLLLIEFLNIDPDLILTVNYGDHMLLSNDEGYPFEVTFIDAKHSPGSVMFLFQGFFGNILYTGDFRYTPHILKVPKLKTVLESEVIDRLYLDNTYVSEHCKFPPKDEVLPSIIEVIRSHPEHYIIIGIGSFGKEDLIRQIGVQIKEKVWVSEDRLRLSNILKFQNVFTTNTQDARIFAMSWEDIESCKGNLQEFKGPVLIIIPSAIFQAMNYSMNSNVKDVYIFPYTNHSCHSELESFVSEVKPSSIYPIVSCDRVLKSVHNKLGLFSDLSRFTEDSLRSFSFIPQSISRHSRNIQDQDGVVDHSQIGKHQANSSKPSIQCNSELGLKTQEKNESSMMDDSLCEALDNLCNQNDTPITSNRPLQNISSVTDLITNDESPALKFSQHCVPYDSSFNNVKEFPSCEDSKSSEFYPMSLGGNQDHNCSETKTGKISQKSLKKSSDHSASLSPSIIKKRPSAVTSGTKVTSDESPESSDHSASFSLSKMIKRQSAVTSDTKVTSDESTASNCSRESLPKGGRLMTVKEFLSSSNSLQNIQVTPFDDKVEEVLKQNFNHAFATWKASIGAYSKEKKN